MQKKKLHVVCIDKNEEVIKLISQKKIPFKEEGLDILIKKQKNYKIDFSSNLKEITNSKFIIVTLGTPIDEYLNPDLKNFKKVISSFSRYLNNKQILIFRSTLAPGTTRYFLNFFRKKKLKLGISFCPERISQGFGLSELESLPQIISYDSKKTKIQVTKIFKKITNKIIYGSFEEAEVSKLFCNTWRYYKFAVANEFYKISMNNNLSFRNIRNLMIYEYPRAADFPKSGFTAGPCLLKDTMQLASFDKNYSRFAHSAMIINEDLPDFIVSDFKKKYSLQKKNVLILGMAFKPNNDDKRVSLAFKLRNILEKEDLNLFCHDPYIKEYKLKNFNILLKKIDIIFVGCPHTVYRKLKFSKKIKLVDCWNFFKK